MKNVNENNNPSRRKLIKSLAAGGGVVFAAKSIPGQWVKPVVDSVALPAHAQTSPDGESEPRFLTASGTITDGIGAAPRPSNNRLVKLLEHIVPKAEASALLGYYLCVKPSADGSTADVQVYELTPASLDCDEGTVGGKTLYTASDVGVPGTDALTLVGNECVSRSRVGALLDKLGIVRSAHAVGASVTLTSVENGATGSFTFGGGEITFGIGVGACSAPECCTEPDIPSPPEG